MTNKEEHATHLVAIEDALHALITAIGDHDAARTDARASEPREIPKLVAFHDMTLEGAALDRLRDIVKDPVRHSLRAALKDVGQKLFRLVGSTGAMTSVLDRVAARDPANAGRRGAIIDSAWNGLGEGNDRWWS